MPRLFSYVVDHDLGYSPNPFGGYCTLALCKFSTSGRPNVVELAQVGHWLVGTGGLGPQSAGHGKLIYAMRLTEKLTLRDYFADRRFRGRADNLPTYASCTNRFALISNDFFYFGSRAVPIPRQLLSQPLEKSGQGFRRDFDAAFISAFERWLRGFRRGIHGYPCGGRPGHAPRSICTPRKQPTMRLKRYGCHGLYFSPSPFHSPAQAAPTVAC